MDHLGDTVHDLIAGNYAGAGFHQFGDGATVTGSFDDEIADQRNGFRMVQLHTAFKAAARDHGGHGYQQFVFFPGRQVHVCLLLIWTRRGEVRVRPLNCAITV